MAPFVTRTGPGGTELLVRPTPWNRPDVSKGEAGAPVVPEQTAWQLQQAVERARREGAREKFDSAVHRRQQFWVDTCREVREMRAASPQVLELHRLHGCRFCAPSARQVQHILDALDSALPAWERDHPGLFFGTLELNFPELVRHCRAHRRL